MKKYYHWNYFNKQYKCRTVAVKIWICCWTIFLKLWLKMMIFWALYSLFSMVERSSLWFVIMNLARVTFIIRELIFVVCSFEIFCGNVKFCRFLTWKKIRAVLWIILPLFIAFQKFCGNLILQFWPESANAAKFSSHKN